MVFGCFSLLYYHIKCLALIHYLFSKYLLNTYYVSGTILGAGSIKTNKAIDLSPYWGDQQLNSVLTEKITEDGEGPG